MNELTDEQVKELREYQHEWDDEREWLAVKINGLYMVSFYKGRPYKGLASKRLEHLP